MANDCIEKLNYCVILFLDDLTLKMTGTVEQSA